MERRRNRLLSYFSRDRERSLVTQPSDSSPPSTWVSSTSLTSVVRSPDPSRTAQANPALEIAIRKHLEELPEAEKDAFQEASKAMTQDNLLSTIRAYDEDHKQNSSFRPRAENLSKLLNLLNRFMAGVSTAIQANPVPAAIIVGAVQVVISLAVEFTTFFDRLTDMLCRFIDYLGPLAEYAKASMDSELIQRTLATAYGDLLKFCRDARHVFIDEKGVQRRWTSVITFLRVQWEPFESTFGDAESKFRHHVNVLDQSAQALQLNRMREAERLRAVKERESFLNWMSRFDFQKIHEDMFAKKHPNTGDWLLNTDEYRSWLKSSGSALLWCYGKPGAGKSVLTSNVLEDVTAKYALREEIGISFVYYNYQSLELGDLSNVISALMKQLCRKKDAIPPWLLKFKHDSYHSSSASSQDSFISLARTFNEVFLIIDALDECPKDERPHIIQFITEVTDKLPCAKIFVTSRRESDIVDAFESSNTPTIKIEAENVAADIKLFVTTEVNRLRRGYGGKKLQLQSDSLAEAIIRTLTDKAEGMFLWVNLQLQHLCTVSESRKDRLVEAALDDIPKGLNTTYTRMLRQIDNQEPYMKALALKCFAWVIHAKRLLRRQELQDAIATKSPCRSREDLELDEVDVILKACANLIAEESGFIRPIHYSVQEFFTNPGLGSLQGCCLENIRNPNFAHRILATSCLSHLQLDVLAKGPCDETFRLYDRLENYPFLWYAARFFDRHVLDLPDLPKEVFDLVTTLLSRDGPSLAAVLQILAVQDPFDYDRILGDFTKVSFEVSASTILYSTVLFDVPQIAEQHAGIAPPDYVLHRASAGGLFDLVIRLIGEGYDIKEEDSQGVTSLYYSCSGGHTEVMEQLVQAGADVNAQGGYYGNALQAAAYGGHEKMVEQLLQAGADVNAQGGYYGNALQAAAIRGHEKMVEQLLQAGADMNAQGGYYGNALQAAAHGGHEKMVEQLLQAGADMNTQDGHYGNALQAAAYGGHEKMVERLLQAGMDANAQGGEYGNTLQAAAYGGHEKIVEQLLQAGMDVNAQGGEYGNALQAAAIGGHEKMVERLLQAGMDVNAQGGLYGNALLVAAIGGHEKIIEQLLQAGADVNAQGRVYGNALQAAARGGHEKIVGQLLQAGADVNAQGGKYGNALQAAAVRGHPKVVERLLQAAANGSHEKVVE